VATAAGRLNRSILLRSLLGAISIVLTILPLIVALGAFVPAIPTVGRFGALAVTHLPALVVESALSAAIATVALALGGGRWTKVLVGLTGATTAAMLAVLAITSVFAWRQNVPFDVFRMARAASTPPTADQTVVIATVGGKDLHAEIWRARSQGSVATPAVIYIHGGAFISGSLESRPDLFDAVASSGTTLVDIEYRLATATTPTWDEAPADVLCAIGWVGSHAEELGIDPAKVVIAGESAGGNLALVAGYAVGMDAITPSCAGAALRAAGVFAVAPTADLVGIWNDKSIVAFDRPFPEAYIGGTPMEFPDRYERASPYRLMGGDMPPTYLLTGANDHFVNPGRVSAICDRVRAVGANCTIVIAPFADHGFDGFPNGYGNQLQEVLLPRFVAQVTG
jgi:acetyl esterase/lipase